MNQTAMALFCCPVCGGALALHKTPQASFLRCKKGHTHDIAHEGYVHLLPAQRMHTKNPGDNKEMIAARRAFLKTEAYGLFARTLSEILCEQLKDSSAPHVLDAGCGEGYYTARFAHALTLAGLKPCVVAFDISKCAVRAAAKQGADATAFAVAGSYAIPVPPKSIDALVDVFSPVAAQEFARVVKRGGVFVYAVPGPRHLFGLKEILYEQPYENPLQDIQYNGFTLQQRIPVETTVTVEGAHIANLFTMTPYYWKTPPNGAQRLAALQTLTTELSFHFLVYRRG